MLHIEFPKNSIIDSDVKFTSQYLNMLQISQLQNAHPHIIQMHWITLRCAYNSDTHTIYNPLTLIISVLN